ncbi:MAG: ATP-binding protein [Ignavibacteriae bacterium]|nr:ATP-binding protein [Ignavibacteriota bacterium]
MRRNELRELISDGESTTVEFKRKFTSPEKIAKEIAAFANTKGGFLIIGVDDDKRIVGVKSEKEEIAQIVHACTFFIEPIIEPLIEIIEIEFKDVVVVHVHESDYKPHRVNSMPDEKLHEKKVYIRQGEESVSASREMIRILQSRNPDAKPLTLSIGDKERGLFTFIEKNKRATVKDFAALVNISERRAARLLVRLVRAGVLNIHTDSIHDYYTLVERI